MADLGFEIESAVTAQRREWLRKILLLTVPLLLVAIGGYYYVASQHYVSTDNAYVAQDKVTVTPEVTGRIIEVATHENLHVNKGDLLFRFHRTPYEIALRQAEANVANARVEVSKMRSDVVGAGADINSARDEVTFATAEYQRQSELLKRGFTTHARQQLAQLALDKAREELNSAQAEAGKAHSALGSGGLASGQPAMVEAALAARDEAALDLARTEVRAPASGIVSQTDRLQIGSVLPAGLPALSLVVDGKAWVEANFKETELRRMRPGQPATIELDAYGTELKGHVESIGAGTGSEFSILPAQNASGNWVKVTQRVPVRIAIDTLPARRMIAGLSAKVRVDVSNGER